MKIFLIGIAFFALVPTGCNNKNKSAASNPEIKDTLASTITDLASSRDIKKLLCQDWENKEDAEDVARSGGGQGLELPYRGFSFFEDATVVQNPRDNIHFGRWSMSEANKMIDIEFNNEEKAQYKIVAIGAKSLILMNMEDKKKIEYRADGKAEKNPADDPFHGSNNQWRIKPARPESNSAIKLRAEQCVLFYGRFLEDNFSRRAKVIFFAGLPACFQWYRGGISVTVKDKLDAKWLNCYYNTDQALKAHAMLENIITKKYKWGKEEGSWVKQSAGVVKQMYDSLRLL